jgi:hypothetical protein
MFIDADTLKKIVTEVVRAEIKNVGTEGGVHFLRSENKQLRERLKIVENADFLIDYQESQIDYLTKKLHDKDDVMRANHEELVRLRLEVIELSQQPQNERYRAGFVYLIEASNGTYKIGRTNNPENRMKTFGVKLPFDIEYLAVIQTDDMYLLEKTLHDRFAGKRLNGSEFYQLDADNVAYVVSLTLPHPDERAGA